jgi:hypothetical protein
VTHLFTEFKEYIKIFNTKEMPELWGRLNTDSKLEIISGYLVDAERHLSLVSKLIYLEIFET